MGETCSAIFLGAWQFDRYREYTNRVFRRSKVEFEDYLRSPVPKGLSVPSSRVLDLFNSPLAPGAQLGQIGQFADQVRSETPDSVRDLIVYYVGHGYFAGHDRQFYVALASMDKAVPDATGLRIASLGEVLKQYAKSFRIYYILDCCFAGEALKALQAGGEGVATAAEAALKVEAPQARSKSPSRGSALLCATSKDDFAMAPSELERTVFSDALIETLRNGDSELGPRLTLAQLAGVVWDRIQAKHRNAPENQVRPVVHAPDQSDGDVSTHVGLFPNPACRKKIEVEPMPVPPLGRENSKPEVDPGRDARPRPSASPRAPDKRPGPLKPQLESATTKGGTKVKKGSWFRTLRRVVIVVLLVFAAIMLIIHGHRH